jgi:hypothetical protein
LGVQTVIVAEKRIEVKSSKGTRIAEPSRRMKIVKNMVCLKNEAVVRIARNIAIINDKLLNISLILFHQSVTGVLLALLALLRS